MFQSEGDPQHWGTSPGVWLFLRRCEHMSIHFLWVLMIDQRDGFPQVLSELVDLFGWQLNNSMGEELVSGAWVTQNEIRHKKKSTLAWVLLTKAVQQIAKLVSLLSLHFIYLWRSTLWILSFRNTLRLVRCLLFESYKFIFLPEPHGASPGMVVSVGRNCLYHTYWDFHLPFSLCPSQTWAAWAMCPLPSRIPNWATVRTRVPDECLWMCEVRFLLHG